jgi:hypothetical protein
MRMPAVLGKRTSGSDIGLARQAPKAFRDTRLRTRFTPIALTKHLPLEKLTAHEVDAPSRRAGRTGQCGDRMSRALKSKGPPRRSESKLYPVWFWA